ncbi:MAG: tRNA lysidine(34) synthetase TilS, partial [Clostridia bacterium]|nr:tRNA lysidine(34) synthetase TilS [Clostridia bacterium]
MTTDLSTTVLATADRYGMLPNGARICVALSGGKDSVALLHVLYSLAPRRALTLSAVHINHGIRGAEADRDEEFCRGLCVRLGIPFVSHRFDVPALAAEDGTGIEECARGVRYGVFDRMLVEGEVDRVATAHHAADSAETVLFNLARGTTLRGAAGIPPVRGGYIRPMIDCTPRQILEYISGMGLNYVEDSTNSDTNYTRNLIRAKVMPVMNEVNGAFLRHIRDFSERAAEDNDFLDHLAKWFKTDDISVLQTLHVSILRRVLSLLCDGLPVTGVHIDSMVELIGRGGQGERVSLPRGMSAVIDRGRLVLREKSERPDYRHPISMGENRFGDIGCTVIVSPEPVAEDSLIIYKKSIHTTIKSDKINGVYIRPRREGDSYRSMGLT